MPKLLREANSRSGPLFCRTSPSLRALLTRSLFPAFYGDARVIGTLAFEEIRVSEKPFDSTAFVLHGLLGSGRNWRSFARDLAVRLHKSSPSHVWRMVLVDLRNHGRSAGLGLELPHGMVNAAKDLAKLVKSQGWAWPDVVIGHSMGGKVSLEFAASCARKDYGESAVLPKQLWVLDSVPGEVNSDETSGEVEKILQTLHSLPSPLPSRKWVVDHMVSLGFSKMLSNWIGSNLKNWIGSNLKNEGDHAAWAFDLQACIEMFKSYRVMNYWPLLEQPPNGLEIAVVRAENSDRWPQHVIERLEYLSRKEETPDVGKVSYYTLPKSGHWVHVDNPRGLLEIMEPHFYSKA